MNAKSEYDITWPELKEPGHEADPEQREADEQEFQRVSSTWPRYRVISYMKQSWPDPMSMLWHTAVAYGRRTAPVSTTYPNLSPAEKLRSYRQWIPSKFATDWKVLDHQDHPNTATIQSGLGPHDERVRMDGNFASAEECRAYAERMALVLNAYFSTSQPEDVPIIKNMVAIDKGTYDLIVRWLKQDIERGKEVRKIALGVLERGSIILDLDAEP